MSFQDIMDYCRAAAIADALHSSDESKYRFICRQYSQTFNTPLHLVYELDPEEVCRAFFDSQLDLRDVDKELESLLDVIYEIEDPNYAAEKREELSHFMKQAEREEEERVRLNKPIHPGLRKDDEVTLKNTSEKPEQFKEPKPTGGSIDLSYLADSENEQ